MLELETYP